MKWLVLISLLFLVGNSAFGQKQYRHTVYGEIGGNTILFSVNYDYMLTQRGEYNLSFRIGCAPGFGLIEPSGSITLFLIPVELNAIFNMTNNSHWELGIGSVINRGTELYGEQKTISYSVTRTKTYMSLRTGYRYQRPLGGFFFRIGFTPLLFVNIAAGPTDNFIPWAGMGAGYSF